MAKKLSKKRTTHLIDITSNVYSKVCKELDTSVEKLRQQVWDDIITTDQWLERKEEIDTLYCKYVCELETKLLEDFLEAHVSGQIRRAQRTLDLVQKELLERVLNEDNKSNDS